MSLPQYALFTFHTAEANLQKPNPVRSDGLGSDYKLQSMLDTQKSEWVEIEPGTYVFRTEKCWQLMQDMIEELRAKKRPVTVAYFEDDLFGCFPKGVTPKLLGLGVRVRGIDLAHTWPEI